MTEDLYCTMNLRLARREGAITMYDGKHGVRRRLQLKGIVHDDGWYPGDGPDDGAPHFHGKPVVVQVHTPIGHDKLAKAREGLPLETAKRIFGVATVNAGVKVETIHVNNESHDLEPVMITLHVAPDAFEAIDQQSRDADEQRRILVGRVTLAGSSLPREKATRLDEAFGLRLKDLDVTIAREYLVRSLELVGSGEFELMRGRVRTLQRPHGVGHGIHLPVLLSEARYELEMEGGHAHSIVCSGRVKSSMRHPYEGQQVEIEFVPYGGYANKEVPRESAFGRFSYWKGASEPHFGLELNYLQGDAMRVILPLLSGSAKGEVSVDVEISTTREELASSEECVRGAVQSYAFRIWRALGAS